MAAEEQSDKMASDMEVHMKQKYMAEFLHTEKKKTASNDINQHLLNFYGEQGVDVSTVRGWVVCFSTGDRCHLRWCRFI